VYRTFQAMGQTEKSSRASARSALPLLTDIVRVARRMRPLGASIYSSHRLNAKITRAIGSTAPTTNAKILNAASLLMMHLAGRFQSIKFRKCVRLDFVSARIAAPPPFVCFRRKAPGAAVKTRNSFLGAELFIRHSMERPMKTFVTAVALALVCGSAFCAEHRPCAANRHGEARNDKRR
jgi:hypothetical protein